MDVVPTNIATTVYAHATQDTLEAIVILELVQMIALVMDIASMVPAIVVQDGRVMTVL